MSQVIQIPNQNGDIVSAIPKDFEIGREDWNEYKFLDGGKVRVKVTVLRILHQADDDGNPTYNKDGSPVLIVNHRMDVVAEV